MEDKYAGLWDAWNVYMSKLNKAEIMLKEKHEEYKNLSKSEHEKFKKEVFHFGQTWKKFKETESKNKDLVPIGA